MKNYITEEIFKDTQCDFSSLRAFGFSCSADFYSYAEDILDGQFKLLVRISKRGNVEAKLIETQFGEEYSLHLVEEARVELVNRVRKAYRALLEKIASRCFKKSVFKSASARRLILHIEKTYGDSPQFLWEKSPKVAVFRRRDSGKWYGVLMVIPSDKLGLDSDRDMEIINLRIDPNILSGTVDNEGYFNAYHMNKKHWVSLNLNSAVPMREIYDRVEYSFSAASGKMHRSRNCADSKHS